MQSMHLYQTFSGIPPQPPPPQTVKSFLTLLICVSFCKSKPIGLSNVHGTL